MPLLGILTYRVLQRPKSKRWFPSNGVCATRTAYISTCARPQVSLATGAVSFSSLHHHSRACRYHQTTARTRPGISQPQDLPSPPPPAIGGHSPGAQTRLPFVIYFLLSKLTLPLPLVLLLLLLLKSFRAAFQTPSITGCKRTFNARSGDH